MKRFTILAVLIGFFVVSLLIARPGLTDQQTEKKAAEPMGLEQMQKDRIAALEELVAQYIATANVTSVTFSEFSKAQNDLIEAKLEATTQVDERIAVLEKQLEVAHDIYDRIDKSYKVGFGKNFATDYFQATAHRLSIKIKLAREQTHKKT